MVNEVDDLAVVDYDYDPDVYARILNDGSQ